MSKQYMKLDRHVLERMGRGARWAVEHKELFGKTCENGCIGTYIDLAYCEAFLIDYKDLRDTRWKFLTDVEREWIRLGLDLDFFLDEIGVFGGNDALQTLCSMYNLYLMHLPQDVMERFVNKDIHHKLMIDKLQEEGKKSGGILSLKRMGELFNQREEL